MKKVFLAVLLLLSLNTLLSCAHISESSKIYKFDETVPFEWFRFEINGTPRYTECFYNFIKQRVCSNEGFVLVEITMTNLSKGPIQSYLGPAFSLIDREGAQYNLSNIQTSMINMGKSGYYDGISVINPNVKYRRKLVFEVPAREYYLRVLVPYKTQLSFGGHNATASGTFFYYDLSSL